MNNNFRFGNLVSKKNENMDVRIILNRNTKELEYLFRNTNNEIEKLNIAEAERRIALENLRTMTALLQARRLRNKIKSSSKYFTL